MAKELKYPAVAVGDVVNPVGCALFDKHDYDVIYTFKMNGFKGYMENTMTRDEMMSTAKVYYNIRICLRCKKVTGFSDWGDKPNDRIVVPNLVCIISNDDYFDNILMANTLAFLLLYFEHEGIPQYWDGEKYVGERPADWPYGHVYYKGKKY